MGDMKMPEGVRLPLDAFDCLRSDQRFIVFELCNHMRAHDLFSWSRPALCLGRAPADYFPGAPGALRKHTPSASRAVFFYP